jgi:hypothetical protein
MDDLVSATTHVPEAAMAFVLIDRTAQAVMVSCAATEGKNK